MTDGRSLVQSANSSTCLKSSRFDAGQMAVQLKEQVVGGFELVLRG